MDFVEGLETYEQVILIGVGILALFLGYRIKKVAFFLIWFVLGYILMGFLMPVLNNWLPDMAHNVWFQNLVPIGGGLIVALLGFAIEKVCISGVSFALVMLITVQYFGSEVPTLVIGGIIGAAAGALSVMLMKPATIVATSVAGGYAITLAVFALFPQIDRGLFFFPMIGGLAMLGSLVQFLSTKKVR